MRISARTGRCPVCGRPATMSRLLHTDEQGHVMHVELELACPAGCAVRDEQLAEQWPPAVAPRLHHP